MTRYEVWLLLHVVGAILWIGAAVTLELLVFKAEKVRDRAAQLEIYAQTDWLANRLFIPASLAVLVFGIVMVADGPWSFDQLWIVVGLAGWGASFIVGIGYFEPEGKRIGAIVEQKGPEAPELDARMAKLAAVGRVELVVLFVVVGAMVAKPTGSDTWTLVIGAIVLAAGLLAGGRAVLRARQAPAVASGDSVA